MRWLALIALLCCAVGCVRARYDVAIDSVAALEDTVGIGVVGQVSPEVGQLDRKAIARLERDARALKLADVESIPVYVGTLPRGVRLTEAGIDLGDAYDAVAVLSTEDTNNQAQWSFLLGGFYRMHPSQRAKNIACNLQSPLVWVTLGIWNFTPFRMHCMPAWPNAPRDMALRELFQMQALQRGARVLDADVVIVLATSDRIYKNEYSVAVVYVMSAESATALALRIRR